MNDPLKKIFDGKFLRLYDREFAPGGHYYIATRRDERDLIVLKEKGEWDGLVPDAVSLMVVLRYPDGTEKLLLTSEYRYPVGQYLLSVPAGLIEPEDAAKGRETAIRETAKRELFEETGLRVKDSDEISILNPCLFSSPGMTDETNAMVKVVLCHEDYSDRNQDGLQGAEKMNGFHILSREEAKALLSSGRDPGGLFYSVYTWIALAAFSAGM